MSRQLYQFKIHALRIQTGQGFGDMHLSHSFFKLVLHFPNRANRTALGAGDTEQEATNSDRPKKAQATSKTLGC
ncbi:hypothetical protein [Nostoc sp. PA-18-2419]|uniref:hypothetical protein n=1 Tax=Nostoc sp. PA-18-2419 TaxID=2575443 RepID=UPI0011087E89|nr:hypothetical protein [Nostoc sp. PA-18-2419]